MRNSLAALCLCLSALPALAHVTIAPAAAPPGTRINATFRIGHGCSAAAPVSTALQVELPLNLTAVQTIAPPGWEVTLVRAGDRVSAVTWKGGEVKEGQVMLFPISFVLPKNESQLAFPAVQFCGAQKAEWTDLPRGTEKPAKPAPLLTLSSTSTLPASAALIVHDGWFRALPGNIPAGGYFILSNGGKDVMVLTGAESPGCGMVMMHRSSATGGLASMQHVPSRDVPAGDSISFSPNGYHLMCMEPKAVMKPGNTVPVTLTFQGGGKMTATFAVRNAAGR
jgi:copper(I)-binding protein